MNHNLGKFMALFFAACFLALQFFPVADTQFESEPKRTVHIEDITTSAIFKSNEFSFISAQTSQLQQDYFPQKRAKPEQQRQLNWAIKRHIENAFRPFMRACLATIRENYQYKLTTVFKHIQKRWLSFDFTPYLVLNVMGGHSDEPHWQSSLS